MKTRIALIPIVALAVVAFGTGLSGPAATPANAAAPATVVVDTETDADLAPAPRRHPLKVLATVTVVPSREERLAAMGETAGDSLMLGAAVDRAVVMARPVGATLPRAQLGNPFYDFARLRRTATE
jgi:hypothetical protein